MNFKDFLNDKSINRENLDSDFQNVLLEGVHDKGIFKAVFLGGGPGSGKDFVLDKTLAGHGLTEINSDKALEFLMDKNNLDMKMPENEKEERELVRGKAKSMTELKQKLALMGRNGVIVNGTGDDVEKIKKIKERLEQLGYDTSMVMVNTADEVSRQRNIERGQRGGRTVPEEIRKGKWDAVQAARAEHAKLFGDNYTEFDNSLDLRKESPVDDATKEAKQKELVDIFKKVQKFVAKPPKSPRAKFWISSELQKKDTTKIDTTKHVTPHEGSNAAEQAKELGLQYYGFGRYGKNGKVTHRSIHDKLVTVEKIQANKVNMPVPGTSMKKVNEDFENVLSESYELSDSGALNILLLGTRIQEFELDKIEEDKKPKYIMNGQGGIRIFMLRRAASEEAHQKNGTVVPFKNGYVVKLKEETLDVNQVFEELIGNSRTTEESRNTSSRIAEDTQGARFLSEAAEAKEACCDDCTKTTRKKITIEEIRSRKKEAVKESIDKGIEPGLSMAGAGEGIGRDMGEKWKKKTGKSSPVAEAIGSGNEMMNSIGDQKEDELKKKGINLSTFKARNPIG